MVLENNQTVQEEVTIYEGLKEKQLRTRVTPLLDAEENSIGALIVMTDMSRIHRLENMRRDFAANVSHELKTPITSIRGYVETLLDGALNNKEDARSFLKIVARQTNRLDAIIDDLLSLARIEDRSRKNSIELVRQEICPALSAAQQTCSRAADKKNITVELRCRPGLVAVSNLPLLEQAVINLLANAITYSPAGSTIIVQATSQVDSPGNETVTISVQDHGSGIAPEHLERIFERFYRCDKARSRANGGTGLGLAIVKHIVRNHGGTVAVASKPGKGSVFTMTLRG
jgi:two-component system phosphate regulon sensor histidine kinase PhoR